MKAKEEKKQRLSNGRVGDGDKEGNDKLQLKDETDSTVGTNDSDDDEFDYLLDDIGNSDGPTSTFCSDLSRTTKNTTIKTSNDDSPVHATVNGCPENKTIQTSSIPQIRNLQTTPVAFRLGIEEISLYKPSKSAASQRPATTIAQRTSLSTVSKKIKPYRHHQYTK